MPARAKQNLNLLPKENLGETTAGRVLQWILTSFRVIVISTELVVIGAFLSRFALDTRGNDLSDEIEAKKAIIVAYQEVEHNFKKTQEKIEIVKQSDQSRIYAQQIEKLSQTIPSDVQITDITITGTEGSIKGRSFSERSISQWLANIKETKTFTTAVLTDISTKENSPFIGFEIQTVYKP